MAASQLPLATIFDLWPLRVSGSGKKASDSARDLSSPITYEIGMAGRPTSQLPNTKRGGTEGEGWKFDHCLAILYDELVEALRRDSVWIFECVHLIWI
jgi:hypothetical protein